ncbi:CRISPR-associated protein Cas2 [Buttiauxella gaviniae]|uniref:CRISPR-associated protein Cas2 n=1 Tax=Buttiauxella gaviniae TaxID=82990 RepID=UPI003C74B8F1
MTTYLISYDLIKNKDYSSLIEKIKSYGTWAKVLESTWIVSSNKSAIAVRDDILSVMDDDDRVFVIKTTNYAAWRHVQCSNDWLIEHLSDEE